MIRTLGNRTKKIYLGHLSKENNIKELAHMTMVNQLAQADLGVGVDFQDAFFWFGVSDGL